MNRQRIEARALAAVNRVLGGGTVEDDLVECKRAWIEPAKAARILAAHANAARGDQILWVIGLDEGNHEVALLDDTDPATWWSQVEARFADGVAPDLVCINVATDTGETVAALAFETDRSPYLVTPTSAGGVDREVPWRAGTRTRSAKRHELLSLLVETASLPQIEMLQPRLTAKYIAPKTMEEHATEVHEHVALELMAHVFFDAREPCMLPRHLWSAAFFVEGMADETPANVSLSTFVTRQPQNSRGILVTRAGAYVNGPDVLQLRATAELGVSVALETAMRMAREVRCTVRMPVSDSTRDVRAHVTLPASNTPEGSTDHGDRLLNDWSLAG